MIALERKTLLIGGLSTVDIKAEEGGSKVVGVLHPETMLHQGTLHCLPNEHTMMMHHHTGVTPFHLRTGFLNDILHNARIPTLNQYGKE